VTAKSPFPESVCSCPACAEMCANSTCLPSPEEARNLIKLGYGPSLAHYKFGGGGELVGPAPLGMENQKNLPHTRFGPCTFFKNNLCTLHEKGLKPLEGRLAHHSLPWIPIRVHLLNLWTGERIPEPGND